MPGPSKIRSARAGDGERRAHLVHRVVVKDADHHVVGSSSNPLLSRDELGRSHREVRDLEALDERLVDVVPYLQRPVVKVRQEPRFGRMEINSFDAVRTLKQYPLHVESQRLRNRGERERRVRTLRTPRARRAGRHRAPTRETPLAHTHTHSEKKEGPRPRRSAREREGGAERGVATCGEGRRGIIGSDRGDASRGAALTILLHSCGGLPAPTAPPLEYERGESLWETLIAGI